MYLVRLCPDYRSFSGAIYRCYVYEGENMVPQHPRELDGFD